MNKALLRKVQEQVATSPHSCDMDSWVCGSTACIGGWAMLLKDIVTPRNKFTEAGQKIARRLYKEDCGYAPDNYKQLENFVEYSDVAQRVIGLNADEANRLFYIENWPDDLRTAYDKASKSARGFVAATRIDRFLKTNGAE